jgi:Domain of unknown function (DUF5666)
MMRRKTMMAAVVLVGMMAGAGTRLRAQEPGQQGDRPGRGAFAGMQHVEGEVTAVAGSTVTVKTEDGAVMQIVTTDNTRVMKGRGVTVKVSDLKVGDGVMAAGNLDAPNKTLHAAVVFATDAAQVTAMRENLGKTYIAGTVTAIDLDNAKMTVERPDHVTQTIGFDETTSFRRGGRGGMGGDGAEAGAGSGAAAGGESITLADIKVGDTVRGRGAVKDGVFVPAELTVGGGRGMGGRRRGGEGATGATPGAGTGSTTEPQ